MFVVLYANGAPDRIRTYDLRLRRATLYPAELRVRGTLYSAGGSLAANRGPYRPFSAASTTSTACFQTMRFHSAVSG